MTTRKKIMHDTADREIVITRVLNAPCELVFKVWTEPEHVAQWWGPTGFTNTIQQMDVKAGGTWRFIMHGPDGVDYTNRIVFTEVTEPNRLVYIHGSDEEDDPDRFTVTITFEKQDGKTKLTMYSLFPSVEQRNKVVEEYGAIEGGNQTMDRLEEYLAKPEYHPTS